MFGGWFLPVLACQESGVEQQTPHGFTPPSKDQEPYLSL
jgi:hypothetical protein